MRNKITNISRILFVFTLVFLGVFVLFRPAHTETNILKAIFSSADDSILVDLSGKFSSKINIIVESDDAEKAEQTSKRMYSKLDKTKMFTSDMNITGLIEDYEKYHNNLLSNKTRRLLVSKQYDKIEENALEMLYNPIMPPVGAIEDDPFLLLTDFVMNLSPNNQISNFFPVEKDGKFYSLVMLNVDSDLALSPTVLNNEVKKLVDLQTEYSKDGVKVYLSGAPVHSYFASSRSIFEINLICILSTLFIIGLVYWYFRSLKPLIPIAISIGLGIYSGYCMTALIFRDIHILTFVFSTTLIGICVDYSLHYFVSNGNLDEIRKSLTVSLITTVSAFVVLLFANFILLRQISVFTITGLVTVYLIVVLFYQRVLQKAGGQEGKKAGYYQKVRSSEDKKIGFLCKNLLTYLPTNLPTLINNPSTIKNLIISAVMLLLIIGLFRIHFDDNIKNMYVPPKNLLGAEKLFSEIAGSGSDTSIIVVKGKNIEDLLEKEEEISDKLGDIEYQSLSRYVPSVKRQKSNRILRKQLYQSKMNEYAVFLTPSERSKLITQSFDGKFLTPDKNFEFLKKNFLTDENTSIMVVYNYKGGEIDGVRVINFQKDISAQIKKCRKICLGLLLPVFGLLYLLLAKIYDYKSGLKIIMPSIFAVLFVFGVLGLFNCPVNLFHLLAIFLIVGFGLDYSIFRFGGSQKAGDGVLMSCLTTVFSFGLLAFTGFKLISSLGFVLSLGLLCSYIFSLILIKDYQ